MNMQRVGLTHCSHCTLNTALLGGEKCEWSGRKLIQLFFSPCFSADVSHIHI